MGINLKLNYMTLNFNFNFIGLNGKEIPDGNAGKILANTLSGLNKGNSIKLWDWSLKLFNGKVIEIDEADYAVLKALIEENDGLTILGKAQLVSYMESEKAKDKKK